jgi:threonine/homoserine/homoserine lactone efflux protein
MTSLTPDLLAALALFAFVSSITPGPNNTMLMASGANFGLKRSLPHMAGVNLGFLALILSVGLGLGGVFRAFPALHGVLQAAGATYLLWLAWKLATAKGLAGAATGSRPQTFWQAVAFQWVNPKAWAMALGAITTYVPADRYVANMLAVSVVFAVIGLPCNVGWTGFGVGVRRFLDRPPVLRAFNLIMAGLLTLSLAPLLVKLVQGA